MQKYIMSEMKICDLQNGNLLISTFNASQNKMFITFEFSLILLKYELFLSIFFFLAFFVLLVNGLKFINNVIIQYENVRNTNNMNFVKVCG